MKPCVKCGFCCTISACEFGKWDSVNKRCFFLTQNDECSKYEEIIKTPGSENCPAFGFGCCMSLFNTRRERKLRELAKCSSSLPSDVG